MKARLELCHGAVRDIKANSLGEIKTTMEEHDVPDDEDNIPMVGTSPSTRSFPSPALWMRE